MKSAALLMLTLGGLAVPSSPAADRQPNIVVLLADDLGYGELGCQGNPQIPTPHVDSIAADGVRCTAAYVTAPNCSPSRAGLLTGKFPTRFGYEFNPIGARNEDPGTGLPASETTLAEALHAVGYTTALIGKWHLGGAADYHPHRHGFDEFFGFMHEGHFYMPPPWHGTTTMLRRRSLPNNQQGRWTSERLIYTTHMGHNEPAYDANNPIVRGGQPVEEPEYLTDAFTREAVDFIDRHQDKPFFLLLAYNAVHSPLQATDAQMQRFAGIDDVHRRIFAGMLSQMDEGIGQVLKKLKQSELEQRTLVIFLSDNGGPTRELTSSNLPLRGEKGSMYEGGLRVPFLVRWTDTLPAGRTEQQIISSTDIYATALAAAGAERSRSIDGRNLLPLLSGQADRLPPERTLYWRQGRKAAVRRGDWKAVNMQRDKRPRWELYDLSTDLSEQHDLAAEQSDRLQALVRQWQELDAEMTPPRF